MPMRLAGTRGASGDPVPGTQAYARGLARDLNQRTLAHKRRILGEDDPSTLMSAHNLAADLRDLGELAASNLAAILRRMGKMQAALDLDHDTLSRRRRVLGEDHRHTQFSVSSLASDLKALDET
jgi:hypothetical protein